LALKVKAHRQSTETTLLEVFRDWEIRSPDRSKLSEFLAELVRSLPRGWTRDASREKELTRHRDDGSLVVLKNDPETGLPAARLYLFSEPGLAKVTNIVPYERSELTRAEYNSILLAYQAIVTPIAEKLGLEVTLTSDQENIADLMSERAMNALRAFSRLANKSTGASHPLDHDRWLKFLIYAHKDDARLDTETLIRWFVEEDGWYDDQAEKLGIAYEFARGLLSEYDKSES
jgi:hypothetical protein